MISKKPNPLRILLLEYVTGGGMSSVSLSHSLLREGTLMSKALATDLGELSGIELATMRDARLDTSDIEGEVYRVGHAGDFNRVFALALKRVDAVWPIAPETHGILENICQRVQNAGKILLNSPPEAVKIASSKLDTSWRLAEVGLPVVPSYESRQELPEHWGRWVLKPDDGAGCEGLRLRRDIGMLEGQDNERMFVAQPYVSGLPVSMSMLCRRGRAWLLSCNIQRMTLQKDRFFLLGCLVNGLQDDCGIFQGLAEDIAAALPQLWGYVGVDLIVTESGPEVLEINPRLTTSYAGLRSALSENPAAMVLSLLDGGDPLAGLRLQRNQVDVMLEGACES